MKNLFFILFTLVSLHTFSQDATVTEMKKATERTIAKDPKDTIPKIWKKGGFYSLNVAQGSSSNWAAGGDKFSLAINSTLSLYAFYKKGKNHWDNTLDMNIGYINTTTLGSRKNDDRVDFLSLYGHAIAPKWNVGGLFNFRSQLFDGYTYTGTTPSFSSTLLSPAYIILSPGIEYKPNANFSAFLSPATGRWTIVTDKYLSNKGAYGVALGKHVKSEFGAFASFNYFKEFNKIISYKGRLDLFSNYLKNPQNIDVYFTNLISVKLTKALALTYSLDMIYDDDVRVFGATGKSPALQLKSMLGIGLMMKF
jgi:hypothetical protein